MRDFHNSIAALNAMTQATIGSSTTTLGIELDLTGFDSCELVVKSGTLTDGAYALSIQETDTSGSGYTDAPAASVLGGGQSFALTDDNVVKHLGYIGSKRYIKLKIVSSAVTSGGALGAVAVLGRQRHTGGQPV